MIQGATAFGQGQWHWRDGYRVTQIKIYDRCHDDPVKSHELGKHSAPIPPGRITVSEIPEVLPQDEWSC